MHNVFFQDTAVVLWTDPQLRSLYIGLFMRKVTRDSSQYFRGLTLILFPDRGGDFTFTARPDT